jgi:hypothetical protein
VILLILELLEKSDDWSRIFRVRSNMVMVQPTGDVLQLVSAQVSNDWVRGLATTESKTDTVRRITVVRELFKMNVTYVEKNDLCGLGSFQQQGARLRQD